LIRFNSTDSFMLAGVGLIPISLEA